MMRRAKLFAEAGQQVDITTVDWWLGYSELVSEWQSSGVMPEGVRIRNIHEDFAALEDWPLETSNRHAEPHALKIPAGFQLHEHPADHGGKRYWYAPGNPKHHSFTEYLRSDGSIYMRTLSNPGASEWGPPYRPVGIYDRESIFRIGFRSHRDWWTYWAKKILDESQKEAFVIQDIEDERFFDLWKRAGAFSVQFIHLSHTKDNSRFGQLKDRWFSIQREEKPFQAVVVPTEWQALEWRERFGGETGIFVVPHFNVNWPDDIVDLRSRRRRVVVVSRLVPEKRVDDSVRIFAPVARRLEDASLEIYGDGPERQKLVDLARDLGVASQVVFHGHSSDGAREFSTARVGLFTSKAEGFGLTILEAMAHGAVPVAFNVRYGPSGMIDKTNGYLVNDRNFKQASESLFEVLTDDSIAEVFGAAAVERASTFTDKDTLAAWGEVVNVCGSWREGPSACSP